MCFLLCAVFCLVYVVENAADGYAELASAGMPWYFMVMPFEDVDEGGRAEVVIKFL